MEILNQANDNLLLLLGKNPYFKNKNYRLNKYCYIHEYKGVKLILNHFTRAMVAMSDEEFSNLYNIENAYSDPSLEYVAYLIENYFLVFDEYKEEEIIDKIREHLRPVIDDNYLKECYDYILFPTTACNARCFYCYENKMSKKPMTIDMADRVTRYIMKKAPNKERPINLRWFGGEPLFNMKVMRYIMNMIKANGYSITTSIISNAYLFNEKIVKEAVEEWNLSFIQITLDGTEKVYNKAKNYIYKNQDEVSPFKKVIENIQILLNYGIAVTVRMNTDMHNVEDLKELTRYLSEKIQDEYGKFRVYCYPLFENEENPRTPEERKILFEKIFELEEVIRECGLADRPDSIDNNIRITHCMVDNGHSINIHPDGTLGVCEHYIDSDNWGYIDEDSNEVITNWEYVHEWREYVTDDVCKNCVIYPSCLKVRKCHDLALCDEWFRKYKFRREIEAMEGLYDRLLVLIEQQRSCCNVENNDSNNGSCYCISQWCDNKEGWCYCISQKQETSTCNEEKCECKKEKIDEPSLNEKVVSEEETNEEDSNEEESNNKEKKSLWDKITDIFD